MDVEAVEKKKLSQLNLIILYFFIYSFIGWALETVYSVYELGYITKRRFLFGPLCPIYGSGALILLYLTTKFKKNNITLFIVSAILFTIFEYIVGYGLDALFANNWWDYTNEILNLNGRVSILYSLIWGIFAVLFLNYMHPFIEKKVNIILEKIPYNLQIILLRLCMLVFIIDYILSCIKNFTI